MLREVCGTCGIRHRTLTTDECADRRMSEKVLQDRVVGRAKRAGWRVAHAGRAFIPEHGDAAGFWITPMSPGWPDLTLAKAGHRLIFLELKQEMKDLEPEQLEWLALLAECGAKVATIRPSDLRTGAVKAILRQGSPLDG